MLMVYPLKKCTLQNSKKVRKPTQINIYFFNFFLDPYQQSRNPCSKYLSVKTEIYIVYKDLGSIFIFYCWGLTSNYCMAIKKEEKKTLSIYFVGTNKHYLGILFTRSLNSIQQYKQPISKIQADFLTKQHLNIMVIVEWCSQLVFCIESTIKRPLKIVIVLLF